MRESFLERQAFLFKIYMRPRYEGDRATCRTSSRFRETVHAVDPTVSPAQNSEARQCWPFRVFARRLVGKDAIQLDSVKLALRVLLEFTART